MKAIFLVLLGFFITSAKNQTGRRLDLIEKGNIK